MRSWNRVLVILEGRGEDEDVLEAVRGVAAEDGEVVLATVVPSFETVPSFDSVLFYDVAAAAAHARHHHLDQVVCRLSHPRVRTLVRVSALSAAEIGQELMAIADEEHCDLVVMAIGRETRRTVAFLLRKSVPLLLVPAPDRPRSPPRDGGGRIPLPRVGLVPAPRPGLAVAMSFFYAQERAWLDRVPQLDHAVTARRGEGISVHAVEGRKLPDTAREA